MPRSTQRAAAAEPHAARPVTAGQPPGAGNARRVLFIAPSLHVGGAERQLSLLASRLHARGHDVTVAVMRGGGALEHEVVEAGVRVVPLGKRGRWDVVRFAARLARLVRRLRPEVIHGYLDVPNLLAALLRPVTGGARIVWGVRTAELDLSLYGWATRAAWDAQRWLSPLADVVVANSARGARTVTALRWRPRCVQFVPNGVDTDRFRPDPSGGRAARGEWGIAREAPVAGLVARLDPSKDHATFLRAVAAARAAVPELRAVCIGVSEPPPGHPLRTLTDALGLDGHVVWAGPQHDVPAALSALDVAVSSSTAEGFPNAVLEAMACGVPCAVTDVGDSALIVGTLGRVVPPREPARLGGAIVALLAVEGRAALRDACRARVAAEFSVDALVARTEQVLFGAPARPRG